MGSGLDGVGQFSRASWSVFAENSQYDVDASSILSVGSFELYAEVAQLVEHDLAKVGVAGSSPVFRSDVDTGLEPDSAAALLASTAAT